VVSLDEPLAAAVRSDWRSAALSPRETAMLGYVEKVTREAWTVVPGDLEALRAAGFDDQAILQINLIASAFAWLNRAADGLGVGKGHAP
jgi:uncharacterized peroxidase-related enzyme